MTKAVAKGGIGRRCSYCHEWFRPRPDGRPAAFCSGRCRQRAYVARKQARAQAAPEITHVSRARPPLLVTSHKKPFFTAEDAEAIFQTIGKAAVGGTDFERVAEGLNLIAAGYLSAARQRMAPTAGEQHRLFQSIESHASTLLKDFGLTAPFDRLDNNDIVNALICAVPANDPHDRKLRRHAAREVDASGILNERRAHHVLLWCLQIAAHSAKLGADAAAKNKGAKRVAPQEEINLVAALHNLYAEATGGDKRKNWRTIDPVSGTVGGPFIRFVQALLMHMHDHLDVVEPPVPAAVAEQLKLLATRPGRIGKRIVQVLRRLKITNRSRSKKQFGL